jgi:predicted nucleic acid-binding protein
LDTQFADQRIGLTDCVSFAIMRRHKIRTAFTFDRHFRLAGFRVIGLK